MGIFNKNEGGLMDVIRCDEQDYLIWKWKPFSNTSNQTNKENSIRWGSSLRVKDGSVAVFVYKQKDGTLQDYIEGPFDEIINTKNLPIITNIIGLAYDGKSPFQADRSQRTSTASWSRKERTQSASEPKSLDRSSFPIFDIWSLV